ncbi:MAG: hypothetical protein IKQ90_10270 [Ruminococcus sp.]|nr:hypothetical protein [Ruminococcus sp.]
MEKTHWKKMTNPNYLGDYSLPEGGDLVAVIDYVRQEEVTGTGGKKETEIVAHLRGQRPFILNKTNMKQIQKLYKTPYIEDWAGRAIQIYYDPTVKFGRDTVGGLRIRPFIPQQQSAALVCTDCGKPIQGASGKSAEWVSKYTHQQYGKELCAECAAVLRAKQSQADPLAEEEK